MNRYAALMTSVACTAILTAGCAEIVVGPEDDALRNVRVMNPHESTGSPGHIVGKTSVTCSNPVDELYVTVRLERLTGDNWIPVEGAQVWDAPCDADERAETCVRQANVSCQGGTYRTAGQGRGVLAGQPG